MAGITAAAFLALAASCGPDVAPQTLLSIAQVESNLSPFVIHDNTSNREYSPDEKAEAIELATRLRAAGHNIDTGIMQVNSGNWTWLGVSLQDTFDPCLNIRASAAELTSYSRYNTGSPTRGFANGYVDKIRHAIGSEKDIEIAATVPAAPHDWNVFPDEDEPAAAPSSITPTPIASDQPEPESMPSFEVQTSSDLPPSN